MNFIPARGKILAEIIEGDFVSAGGIYVVSTIKKNLMPSNVKVVLLGKKDGPTYNGGGYFINSKGKLEDYRAVPGQTAYIKLEEGVRLDRDGKKYLILENADIVAVED